MPQLRLTLAVPPDFVESPATPQRMKARLQRVGLWPGDVRQEQWHIDTLTPGGYLVQLVVHVEGET